MKRIILFLALFLLFSPVVYSSQSVTVNINNNTLWNGSGAPSPSVGQPGDFYMDSSNWAMYGPLTPNGWGNPVTLIGPPGMSGGSIGVKNVVSDFGADPTGATDSTVALTNARNYIAAQSQPTELVFPAGVYVYSVSPNWAITNAQIVAEGDVRLRYTGTGNAVIIDAGVGSNVWNMSMGRFIVEATSAAQNGVFVRNVHHGNLGFDVRGCGSGYSGLVVNFAVCTIFDRYTCSNNEGWYNGAAPLRGMWLDQGVAGNLTAYCTFINPIIEGVQIGAVLNYAQGNTIIGGTIEGCSQVGLDILAGSYLNKIYDTDFESNTNGDILIYGNDNTIQNCDSQNLLILYTGAQRNRIINGNYKNINNFGAFATLFSGVIYNRSGSGGTFTDNGYMTKKVACMDASSGVWTP